MNHLFVLYYFSIFGIFNNLLYNVYFVYLFTFDINMYIYLYILCSILLIFQNSQMVINWLFFVTFSFFTYSFCNIYIGFAVSKQNSFSILLVSMFRRLILHSEPRALFHQVGEDRALVWGTLKPGQHSAFQNNKKQLI